MPSIMNAPVQIRKPEITERLRRIAAREGKSITDLVDELTLERDQQIEAEVERRRSAVKALLNEVDALPRIGPLLTDDDLYDEDGLPK